MSAPPAILKAIDPMSFALHSGVQHRLPALPVVDASGRYAGVLPRSRLMALALPRVLSHDEEKYPPSDLLAAGFGHDSLADLQSRMDAVAHDPMGKHLDTAVPVVKPDTPLTSTLMFLHRQRNVLPVVEDGKLLVIISVWDVLTRIGRLG
jgi:CBS-domain-containing membrane protein